MNDNGYNNQTKPNSEDIEIVSSFAFQNQQ